MQSLGIGANRGWWAVTSCRALLSTNWKTVEKLEELKQQGAFLKPGDSIPEPELWFHDIFRKNGTPFDQKEVDFIKGELKGD